ncbi:MAG: class I SAM-dependent methyltransferase [Cyanobacteria bacterium P01_D01_bin.71]
MSSSQHGKRSPQITLLQYYEQRHSEYEAIYMQPERQQNLTWLESQISNLVAGKRVLEIACGTGYWTRRIAASAASIQATDASQRLASAAKESCDSDNVTSGTLDAFNVPASPGFECLVAGFFFSHVPIDHRQNFLAGLAKALDLETHIVLFDNQYVEGRSTTISRRTDGGDTYQRRRLLDGSAYEVIKNFPTTGELRAALVLHCSKVEILESEFSG